MGKRYPFTFKMMLPKLYDLDEWAKKVKNVVEMSQRQFKTLAERECEQGEKENVSISKGKKAVLTRARSHSVMGTRHRKDSAGPPSPITRQARGKEFRALKKRCIGRRKSVAGPMRGTSGVVAGEWIYDAAISSIEQTLTTATTDKHPVRPRHRSLAGAERIAARDAAHERAKTVSIEEVRTLAGSERSFDWGCNWDIPEDENAGGTDKAMAERRTMSLAELYAADATRRTNVKRPLDP